MTTTTDFPHLRTEGGRPTAMFVVCDDETRCHAGVAMQLVADPRSGKGRTVLHDTLRGIAVRVDPTKVRPTADMSDDDIVDALFACPHP